MDGTLTIPVSLATYALLSSYCLCGGILEHAAVFRGWLQVHEPRQLKSLQSVSGYGALYTYVIPKTVLTIFNAYLVCSPPLLSPGQEQVGSALRFGLAMLGISWASSFLVQVPLQLRIQKTPNQELVGRLNRTTWVRTVTMALHGASTLWMMFGGAFASR